MDCTCALCEQSLFTLRLSFFKLFEQPHGYYAQSVFETRNPKLIFNQFDWNTYNIGIFISGFFHIFVI